MATCVTAGNNHSADIVRVFNGRPEPTTLCGYHAQRRHLDQAVQTERARVDRPRDREPVAWQCDCLSTCICDDPVAYAVA